jgi:hypothetical protein
MARKVRAKISPSRKLQLQNDYRKAVAERRRLTDYLKAAAEILSKDEMALLLEFAQLAKRKCDRLRRAIRENTDRHAA